MQQNRGSDIRARRGLSRGVAPEARAKWPRDWACRDLPAQFTEKTLVCSLNDSIAARTKNMNNAPQRSYSRISGFRLGIYVFRDAEIVDYAAPFGVFSVARRFDPELDAFLIAEAMRPVQTQAGFTVVPNYSFLERPTMNAFLIPGGFGTRQETHNGRLHAFVGSLPESTLLTSVCTGVVDLWRHGAA